MDIYALQLIKHLQQIDQQNEYFIFVRSGPDKCLEETRNFKIIEISALTYADWEQIQLPFVANKLHLDLMHCTSNTSPLNLKAPLVITVHDIIYLNQDFGGGSPYQRLGHYYRKWVVPTMIKKAETVITVSDFEKNHILETFPEANVVSVYNGVNPLFLKPITRNNDSNEHILFHGNTAPKKNMAGVLQAYDLYMKRSQNPAKLKMTEITSGQLETLLDALNLNHLRPHIELTGYIPNDQLPRLYAEASMFLYPSLRESFGIPIIEAMACGTPVITSQTSAMPEVAGDAAILINPKDLHQMADAMVTVEKNPDLRESLIKAGKQRVTQFGWDCCARKTLEQYKGVFEKAMAEIHC